ncbi:hypothetical protein CR983_00810 [Candidatus Saccharibacteria bacterium]|nr:MAG: hypothetical protein CR983_00810 [Candidatus Saccharibacteria bacterium]
MRTSFSRTKIAQHVADELQRGQREVIRQLAAYLIETRQTDQVDMYVRTILEQLERDGIVLADVTTAHRLASDIDEQLASLTGATQLTVREQIEPSVLGGIRIETPTRTLDATLRHRISNIRERKL